MLVISRKENEGFKIGRDIEINVVRLGKGNVRIGIKAPDELLILRNELDEFETTNETNGETQEVEPLINTD